MAHVGSARRPGTRRNPSRSKHPVRRHLTDRQLARVASITKKLRGITLDIESYAGLDNRTRVHFWTSKMQEGLKLLRKEVPLRKGIDSRPKITGVP